MCTTEHKTSLFLIPQWSESQTKSQIKRSLNKHFACCEVDVSPVVEKAAVVTMDCPQRTCGYPV